MLNNTVNGGDLASNSKTASLSFFSQSGDSLQINPNYPLSFWVDHNYDNDEVAFISVKSINSSNSNSNQLTTYSLKLAHPNLTINIQIKPLNQSSAYLLCFKYDSIPLITNQSQNTIDSYKIFCPSDLVTFNNETYYAFIQKGSLNTNQKSAAYYGIRDLTQSEYDMYCVNRTNTTSPPALAFTPSTTNIRNSAYPYSYQLRNYVQSCMYFDPRTLEWLWDGVTVIDEVSDISTIGCSTQHLTDFTGGFVVLPPTIDFGYVFANASFIKNPTVYVTVIVVTNLYIILFIWCFYMDREDSKKTQVYILEDNCVDDLYFYEMIVFTGNRKDAGTDSKVSLILI